jgi:hypothetical protein
MLTWSLMNLLAVALTSAVERASMRANSSAAGTLLPTPITCCETSSQAPSVVAVVSIRLVFSATLVRATWPAKRDACSEAK